MSAKILIDEILQKHHAFLKEELPIIDSLVRAYAPQMKTHPAWEPLEASFRHLRDELAHHLSKEEAMLFPSICHIEEALEAGHPPDLSRHDIRESLAQSEAEHDQSEDLLRPLMGSAGQLEQEGKCLDLVARLKALHKDLKEHVSKEENGLFPEARFLYAKATEGRLREE